MQTENYAQAVISADGRLESSVREHRVRFRLERQANVFDADPPPHVQIIMGDGALSLVVGDQETMPKQLDERLLSTPAHPA